MKKDIYYMPEADINLVSIRKAIAVSLGGHTEVYNQDLYFEKPEDDNDGNDFEW